MLEMLVRAIKELAEVGRFSDEVSEWIKRVLSPESREQSTPWLPPDLEEQLGTRFEEIERRLSELETATFEPEPETKPKRSTTK